MRTIPGESTMRPALFNAPHTFLSRVVRSVSQSAAWLSRRRWDRELYEAGGQMPARSRGLYGPLVCPKTQGAPIHDEPRVQIRDCQPFHGAARGVRRRWRRGRHDG
jgi:hypothetical protein